MADGGWFASQEDWESAEGPLKLLDPDLSCFARKHGLTISRNLKDWPERSLAWGEHVRCLIQLYLADPADLRLNLWICASQDRDDGRYWRKEMPVKGVVAQNILADFTELLEAAKRKLDAWSQHPEELEFATKLAR